MTSSEKTEKPVPPGRGCIIAALGSVKGQMTDHSPCAVGSPCLRMDTKSLKIRIFSSSQLGPKSLEQERPVSSILAIGCSIPDQPCQESKPPTALDRVKSPGKTDPPGFSCVPAQPQSTISPPFLSELPAPGRPAASASPRRSAGGWFAIRAALSRPTFPSPPGASGAWETLQGWL